MLSLLHWYTCWLFGQNLNWGPTWYTDVKVGDELLVDGGMVRFDVIEKIGPDVKCRCTDPGLLLPRANLTFWRDGSLVRERNAMLPTISSKVSVITWIQFYVHRIGQTLQGFYGTAYVFCSVLCCTINWKHTYVSLLLSIFWIENRKHVQLW